MIKITSKITFILILLEAATRGVLEEKLSQACNFIKKETLTQVFSCEFCKVFKKIIFTEHLWATASILSVKKKSGQGI